MSWLFSQALVAAYSAECLPDGIPCAQLNVTLTAQPFWRGDKMTDFSRLFRSGPTCAALMGCHGADLLTWFRRDFLARTYPLQAPERGLIANGAALVGVKPGALLAKFDPDIFGWKTAQPFLDVGLTPSLPKLPKSGALHDGKLFRVRNSVHGTNANVGGLLPTLVVFGNNNAKRPGTQSGNGLATVLRSHSPAAMLPTLRSSDATRGGNASRMDRTGKKNGECLRLVLLSRKMMPTLTAQDASKWNLKTREEREQAGHFVSLSNHLSTSTIKAGGSLNPEWLEWFMGWPIGWTALQPLETDKFQSWLKAHGGA